jgi:TRAP-type mannitol/chloroaromatic compound transport system permease large subunit
MLAALYIGYIILLAAWKPKLMPPLAESERRVALPAWEQALAGYGSNALTGLFRVARGGASTSIPRRTAIRQLFVALLPALFIVAVLGLTYRLATAPEVEASTAGLIQAGGLVAAPEQEREGSTGLIGATEPEEKDTGVKEPPAEAAPDASPAAEAKAEQIAKESPGAPGAVEKKSAEPSSGGTARLPVPLWLWIVFGVGIAIIAVLYALWNWERFEVFKMLLSSFFPLALLILAVLGSIVFGLATPSEAAAVGGFGGFVLAAIYRFIGNWREARGGAGRGGVTWTTAKQLGNIVKESSFLTAKTSAMVCWLFVGSGIFSAAFALLGGQEVIEKWVLSMEMTPVQFMILAQFIIFLLGWPLEWTEIIIIFMPIFIPLLPHFNIDPLFFGLLVALNLQTAFLSPPVAMAAFYLKGVSPPHVTLNAIFAGMMPFMGIQVIALILLYLFPAIGLWLPSVIYK